MATEQQRRAVRRTYRNLRDDRGLSAIAAAFHAGIDVTLYSKIENGWREPTDAQRKAIARVLRVKVADLPTLTQEAA